LACIEIYTILIFRQEFKKAERKYNFLMEIHKEIREIITYELFEKIEQCRDILREYFEFFAQYNLFKEGLQFFEYFSFFIKNQKFNSVKSYLFYFAYQLKKYSSPTVKELLSQQLLNAQITDPKEYLDFCVYCFFKGLHYIEKKNFFMATYLYCTAVKIGLNNQSDGLIVINEYSLQMIRALCFLKLISDFNVNEFLFKGTRYMKNYETKTGMEDIDICLSFIRKENIDLETFEKFLKIYKEAYQAYKLIGLKNLAKDMIMLRIIKENLKIYKKIKLTKLAAITSIEYNNLLKVIKKKCMEGELNVKYDEESDVIEVFDLDQGLKENVKKTQELYKTIIEGNKDYFLTLRDNKLKELNNEGKQGLIINNQIILDNDFYDEDDDDDDQFYPGNRAFHG
jgi:hypothetical protein